VVLIGTTEAATAASGSASRVITTSDGARVSVDTLVTGLDAPSSLAATPDGRVFVAQASGKVSIWQGGLLPTPAVILSDVQRAPGTGLVGLTLDPEFRANGYVYVAYVGRSRTGALVNRIVRLQDFNNVLRESVVIFEDPVPAVAPRAPRMRFGPDKKLYVAFPAADWSIVDSYASYAGKVLRLNKDGTTPRDNPRASPIISSGHAATGGFDWNPDGGRLWLPERDRNGRDVLGLLSADFEDIVAASFASEVDPSGTAFSQAGALSAFNGDLFIAGLAGQELRRVHFSPRDPTRIVSSERLLKGELGRLSDVAAGPDGTLYLSTSNRGTASAAANDDRLLRLSPAKP
jgi:glucose/arabinose dehydrogenase